MLINHQFTTPILGFSAYSGTGKTTLLTQIIPLLHAEGLRLAIIKHAHHEFDVDQVGKDSYKLRHAGARQMLISSSRRWALMTELSESDDELSLSQLIAQIDQANTDLILVEGFKRESFLKIELHRPSLGLPLMCTSDDSIIALASDAEISAAPKDLPRLDLNHAAAIACFIRQYFHL